MSLARNGFVFKEVVEAIRYQLSRNQDNDPAAVIALKVNLAAALIGCANNSPVYDDFDPMYNESEKILLSVLREQPDLKPALDNLATIRTNRATRPEPNHVDPQSGSETKTKSPRIPSAQVNAPFLWPTNLGRNYCRKIYLFCCTFEFLRISTAS